MTWIIEHWKIVVIGAVVLGAFIAFGIGLTNAIPSSETVKQWSIQEAIFYGFCVLAFATWIGR